MNEWSNDQYKSALKSLEPVDLSLWKTTRWVTKVSTPSPPLVTPEGIALSDSEKAEALADSLESQFQPLKDPPEPTVIKIFDEAMRAYTLALASKPKLNNPAEVQDGILVLKFGKAPGPNGIPNRALKHLPQGVYFLVKEFDAILRLQCFPPAWKHACLISILKPWKDQYSPRLIDPLVC
jgi:hypothetical protein